MGGPGVLWARRLSSLSGSSSRSDLESSKPLAGSRGRNSIARFFGVNCYGLFFRHFSTNVRTSTESECNRNTATNRSEFFFGNFWRYTCVVLLHRAPANHAESFDGNDCHHVALCPGVCWRKSMDRTQFKIVVIRQRRLRRRGTERHHVHQPSVALVCPQNDDGPPLRHFRCAKAREIADDYGSGLGLEPQTHALEHPA